MAYELRLPKAAAIAGFQNITSPLRVAFGVFALLVHIRAHVGAVNQGHEHQMTRRRPRARTSAATCSAARRLSASSDVRPSKCSASWLWRWSRASRNRPGDGDVSGNVGFLSNSLMYAHPTRISPLNTVNRSLNVGGSAQATESGCRPLAARPICSRGAKPA